MPILTLPNKTDCIHNNIHGKWIVAQGVHYAVCAMPRPYLINCIEMLQRTLDEAYPVQPNVERSPLTLKEIAQTEDQLKMLKVELERRNDKTYRSR